MTRSEQVPPWTAPAQYLDAVDDEDEELSPSDGYFGGNTTVPDTVLIPQPNQPSPDRGSKAKEAAREAEYADTNTPSDMRYASYTPATAHTPATSSRDGESAYNGSTSRYRDSEDAQSERSPLLDEPPPMYDEVVGARAPDNNHNINGANSPISPPRGGYESMQVRDPVSSFRTSGLAGRNTPQSMAVSVNSSTGKIYDEESDPANPRRSRRRGCSRRRETSKARYSKCKRLLPVLVASILVIWLVVHLAKIANHAHRRFQAPNYPTTNGTSPPSSRPRPAREFCQHETSNSISGTYNLYDLLDLQTTSGSISITVVPQPGDHPAVLRLSTTSGSINVKIAKGYLDSVQTTPQYRDALNRTFDITATSTSGSIGGSFLVGGGSGAGTTTITTRSGSLNLAVYPLTTKPHHHSNQKHTPPSTLRTSTTSGSSNIQVRSPVFGGTLTQLVAHHDSVGSGSLHIKYPSTWEGGIHAKSVGSGSAYVKGPGLQFEQNGNKEVIGWRGDGEKGRKMVELRALGSGSVYFAC